VSAAHSVYPYDTATSGTGYVSQLTARLPELLQLACAVLDTQYHPSDLDRYIAIAFLSAILTALNLPAKLRAFRLHSLLKIELLPLVLNREWQRWHIQEFRIYIGGKARN
jgi:hypothetical protein